MPVIIVRILNCHLIAEKHHGTIEIIWNRSVCGFLLLLLEELYIIIVLRFILGIIGVHDPSIGCYNPFE